VRAWGRDDEVWERPALWFSQREGLEEHPGCVGTEHAAGPVFAGEAEHGVGDVGEAPAVMNDVEIKDSAYLVAGEEDVLAMEV
jgi:hypothetical protein